MHVLFITQVPFMMKPPPTHTHTNPKKSSNLNSRIVTFLTGVSLVGNNLNLASAEISY